jgi:hypothetical protein
LQGRSPNKHLTNRRENRNGKEKKRTKEKDKEIKKPAWSPEKI